MKKWNQWRATKSFLFFFIAVGMAAGFLYYRLVGCATGTCPISSNPVISTLYGGLFGFLISQILSDTKQPSHAAEKNRISEEPGRPEDK